jgi:hypothetical protein
VGRTGLSFISPTNRNHLSKLRIQSNGPAKYNFAVHPSDNSPLRKGRYAGKGGKTVGGKVKKVLRKDEPNRTFKYSVSVWEGGRIWTDDPTFIIEA